MRVVFRFGVYIVTKSVMGLWWFRWIVFSLSCIGLATSLTSSKSYCINYFYFRTKLCCCDFCKCFYKITSKSFLFSSDWLIRGRNANTWDSLLYYNYFLGNQKNMYMWYLKVFLKTVQVLGIDYSTTSFYSFIPTSFCNNYLSLLKKLPYRSS